MVFAVAVGAVGVPLNAGDIVGATPVTAPVDPLTLSTPVFENTVPVSNNPVPAEYVPAPEN